LEEELERKRVEATQCRSAMETDKRKLQELMANNEKHLGRWYLTIS